MKDLVAGGALVLPDLTEGVGQTWHLANNIYQELAGALPGGVWSMPACTRDQFGASNKFITPAVANGKVYVGTTNGVVVFGLLH